MAFNLTKAKLAEFTDWVAFEQMCVALLVTEYPRIIPLGGCKDGGRDAIQPPLTGAYRDENAGTIFQFSLQKDWQVKLKADLGKTFQNAYKPGRFVFVTNQEVTSLEHDRERELASQEYGVGLVLYDIKWLCARLESPEYVSVRRQYLGLDESTLPAFLTTDEYAQRRIDRVSAPELTALLGRRDELSSIERFATSATKVLVLSGLPGVGKTKLLLEAARKIDKAAAAEVRFVRTDAGPVEHHFQELDPKCSYVLVLDDAHEFEHFRQLLGLLASPEFGGRLHVVVATHPWAKNALRREFELFRYSCEELCVGPLPNADVDKLLQDPAVGVTDGKARAAILTAAEGNPLVALAAASMWRGTHSLVGLTRNEFLSAYFARALEGALGRDSEKAHLAIAILAATRGLKYGDGQSWAALARAVGLSEGELSSLVDRLVSFGLVRRTWSGLRVVPDLLAEHVMFEAFFVQSRRYDFSEKVIAPFFAICGDRILTSLGVAESLGADSARAILDRELKEIGQAVKGMDNARRSLVLHLLKGVAWLRPEDCLLILRPMLESPMCEPAGVGSPRWGRVEITAADVLREAAGVLRETWLSNEASLRGTLDLLYLVAGQQDHSRANQDPWGDSLRVMLEHVICLQPGKDLRVQDVALEKVDDWLRAGPDEAQQGIIAQCLAALLSITWTTHELSAVDGRTVTIEAGTFRIDKKLEQIRGKSIGLCGALYAMADSAMRVRVIEWTGDALGPHGVGPLAQETREMLTRDTRALFTIFEHVSNPRALAERYKIWEVLTRLHQFAGIDEVPGFYTLLYSEEVRMFAHLTQWPGNLREGEVKWQDAAERHDAYWRAVIEALTPAGLGELMERIGDMVRQAAEANPGWLSAVDPNLRAISSLVREHAPEMLGTIVGGIGQRFAGVKAFAGSFLGELYSVDHALACSVGAGWIESGDQTLRREACRALFWLSAEDLGEAELRQIERLADVGEPATDGMLVGYGRLLSRLQVRFREKAVSSLKQVARRCDDSVLGGIAELLEYADRQGDTARLVRIGVSDLKEVVQRFVQLGDLDRAGIWHVESMLRRLFEADPDAWLEFWEARIKREAGNGPDVTYTAAPFHLYRETSYVASSKEALAALGRFLEWSSRPEWPYKHNGARLFRLYFGGQSSAVTSLLDAWIESGELRRLQAVARAIKEIGYGDYFLNVAAKLLNKTDDDLVQAYLREAVGSTGVVTGSLTPVFEARKADFEKWLADPQASVAARAFARQQVAHLGKTAELHAEDDYDWP